MNFSTTSSTDREQILLNPPGESDLGGNTDDTAGGTAAGVAGGERVLVAALAVVVGADVDNDGAADNRVGADERDLLVCGGSAGRSLPLHSAPRLTGDVNIGVARAVGLDIAEVTNVTVGVGGTAVVLAMRVKVRAGRSTAVRVVTKPDRKSAG